MKELTDSWWEELCQQFFFNVLKVASLRWLKNQLADSTDDRDQKLH